MGNPDFPDLRKIFDFSDPPMPENWKFNFRGDHAGHDAGREKLVWKYLDRLSGRHEGHLETFDIPDLRPKGP